MPYILRAGENGTRRADSEPEAQARVWVDDRKPSLALRAQKSAIPTRAEYSAFSIEEVKSKFALRIATAETFAGIPPVEPSAFLVATLAENVPLAVAISTEKARSEFIIAPVLLEARRQVGHRVSLFSGVEFEVDPSQGLNGVCDFLLSLSPEQLTIEAPVVAVVEAKKDDLKSGLGQCMAEMVAARLFNRQKGRELTRVYGVVTTGSLWKFMRLEGDVVSLDQREYPISELPRIVGILVGMLAVEDTTEEPRTK